MTSRLTKWYFIAVLLLIAALLGLVGYALSNIVGYLVASLVLSTILKPVVNNLTNLNLLGLRIPRIVAVLIGFGLLIGLLVLVVLLFAPLIIDQVNTLSQLNPQKVLNSLREPVSQLERFLIRAHLVEQRRGFILKALEANTLLNLSNIDFPHLVNQVIVYTGNIFVTLLAVTFMTFFLLYDRGILKRMFLSVVPNAYFELTAAALFKIEKLLTNYLMGLVFQILSIFGLTAVGLGIIGVEYALTLALFAAVINIIPYIGPLVGSLFSILIGVTTAPEAATNSDLFILTVQIGALAIIVHLIDNILIQPLIFSKSVQSHPLEIFVAIFAGAALAGVIGMITAIPVYTVVRVTIQEIYKGFAEYRIFQLSSSNPFPPVSSRRSGT